VIPRKLLLRACFLLETLAAVREVWPENLPLTARFGVIEYDGRDEQTLTESIELARRFKAGGLDLLSVSVGFTIADTQIPWGPAFLGPIAERVRREAGIPVTSAWGFGTRNWRKVRCRLGRWIWSRWGARIWLIRIGRTLPPRNWG